MTRRERFLRDTPRRGTRGFSLIEMMIAMILGLMVTAGVISVFLAGQQSYRTNNALADVEDGSRVAFELMARDIREAGMTGCGSSSSRVANVLSNSPNGGGSDWWANWNNALHGYDNTSSIVDPALTGITGNGAPVVGTDSLQIISAGSLPVTVASDQEPAANFKLNAPSPDLQSGDVIIVCSPDHATIVQITNYNNNNVTVVHNTGTGTPGNCSKGLGYPTQCTTNGNVDPFPTNSTIAAMQATDWYIGKNPAGGTSLYRIALVNSGGTGVTTQAQEMVRDVKDMQITYLENPNTSFVPAASVGNWNNVTAARVTLTLQSNFQRASVKGNQPITRVYSATSTVRNRVN